MSTLTVSKAHALSTLLRARGGDSISFLAGDDSPRHAHFHGLQKQVSGTQESDVRDLKIKMYVDGEGELLMGVEDVISLMDERRFFIHS